MPEITLPLLNYYVLVFCFMLSIIFCCIFLLFYLVERTAFRHFREDLHFDDLNLRPISKSVYRYLFCGIGIESNYVYDKSGKLSAGVLFAPSKAMPVLTEICEKALELHSAGVTPKIYLSGKEFNKVFVVDSITHTGCNVRITGVLKKKLADE